MKWVIVSIDHDEVIVMGEFNDQARAEEYLARAYRGDIPSHPVVVRPILSVAHIQIG